MQIVLVLHNLVRWAILLFGLWALVNGLTGVIGKRKFTAGDNRSGLLFMISCDIQLLLGLILYFGNSWYANFKDMADTMKNANARFFTVEHTTMMLLAWVLVHVGKSSVKKAVTPAAKHKRMLIFFGLAMLLILAAIPWPCREAIARPLFRS